MFQVSRRAIWLSLRLTVWLSLRLLVPVVSVAWGGEPEPSAGLRPQDLEPPPRIKAAGYVYGTGEGAVRTRLESALFTLIRVDPRLRYVDPLEVVDPSVLALVVLRQAYQQVDQAQVLLFPTGEGGREQHPSGAQVVRAQALLLRAIPVMARELGHVGEVKFAADQLKESWAYLATAYYLAGDLSRAEAALSTVYDFGYGLPATPVGLGRLSWEGRLFPEAMRPFVEQCTQRFDARKPGRIIVSSVPAGAQVLISGRRIGDGQKPLVLNNVPAGDIYVTWLLRNHRPFTMAVRARSGVTVESTPQLPRFLPVDPLEQVEAVEGQLGGTAMPFPLVEAAHTLGADLLVLLSYRQVSAKDREKLMVTGYVYDRRVQALRNKIQVVCSTDLTVREMEELGAALLRGVDR